jgi:hypothetical protein
MVGLQGLGVAFFWGGIANFLRVAYRGVLLIFSFLIGPQGLNIFLRFFLKIKKSTR